MQVHLLQKSDAWCRIESIALGMGAGTEAGSVASSNFAELEDKGLHAPSCKCLARQRLTQVRPNLANRVVIPIPVQSKAGSRGVSMVFAAVSQQISAGYNSGNWGVS